MDRKKALCSLAIAVLCTSIALGQGLATTSAHRVAPPAGALESISAATAAAELAQKPKLTEPTGPVLPPTRVGGDTCQTATVIPSVPYTDTGNTCGYADDYEFACPYDSTAPDVVYAFTPGADVVVDISVCDSAYDTKLMVFENICLGTPIACNDDSCGSDGYKSQILYLTLETGSTYYIVVDGYDVDCGDYILSIAESTPPPSCPEDSLYSAPPEMVDWTAGTADAAPGYTRFETFDGVTAPICGIQWWGVNGYFNGSSWVLCEKLNEQFEISFYADSSVTPGTPVATTVVTPLKIPTGFFFGSFPLYYYSAPVDPCVSLTDGWVSLRGLATGQQCWFLWAALNTTGGGQSLYRVDGDPNDYVGAYDMAFCLAPTYEAMTGACCNLMDGTCTDNVDITDCIGVNYRFVEGATCAELDPPCEPATGACCYANGTCEIITYKECISIRGDYDCDGDIDFFDIDLLLAALQGERSTGWTAKYFDKFGTLPPCDYLRSCDADGDGDVDFFDIDAFLDLLGTDPIARTWVGAGTTCEDCPCIVICPEDAVDEGEPCGQDTNGGCNTDPANPPMTPITCGTVVCGTIWADGGTRDTDWYEVTLTEPTTLIWTVESEVPVVAGLLEQEIPGIPGCDNLTGYLSPYVVADPCDKVSITTECLIPGTYYVFVAPAEFEGFPCGEENDYVASLACEPCVPPAGACCLRDGSCQSDVWEAVCLQMNGFWQGEATSCDPNPCPQPPENDDCVTAEPIAVNTGIVLNTLLANDDPESQPTCGTGLVNQAVWYSVVGTGTTLTATTCSANTQIDSKIQVWCNECNNLVCVGGDDDDPNCDPSSLQSTVSWCTAVGEIYYIAVGGYSTNAGQIELFVLDDGVICDAPVNCEPPLGRCCYGDPVECVVNLRPECEALGGDWYEGLDCTTACPIPVTFESCDTAYDITAVPFTIQYDSDNATADNDSGSCQTASPMQNDVWFKYTPAQDCYLTLDIVEIDSYDMVIAVYTGPDCLTLTEILCDDDPEPYHFEWQATAGTTYWIQQGDYGTTEGGGLTQLDLNCSSGQGACCFPIGDCAILGAGDCAAQGGEYLGDGTTCDPNPCPPPTLGEGCYYPVPVTLSPATLPYVDANRTNCGLGNTYDGTGTCLSSYDNGEDIIYELDVTEPMSITIRMDPQGTTWSGIAIGDACPPTDSCLAAATGSSGTERVIECVALAAGKYYIMIDTWPSPTCIPSFTLTIEECVVCDITCDPAATPEPEPCGQDTNGGCLMDVPAFDPITCDQIYCGTVWADPNFRDLDWYEITTTEPTKFTWTVTGEVDLVAGLVETTTPGSGNCADITGYVSPYAVIEDCEQASVVTTCLPAGTYWFLVMPAEFVNSPCSLEYQATLTCEPCTVDPYCAASGGCDEYITSVTCGAIDNASGACSEYADYTAMSTNMDVGGTYPITVVVGSVYSSDKVNVWIDWNQNYTFDEPAVALVKDGANFTGDLVPPVDAVAGPTRMRVRLEYSTSIGPCGNSSYGEVEDYTVNVIVPTK